MYWSFTDDWYMFSTYGMTGQWSPNEGKHPCFGFYLGENALEPYETIYFNDPRHFGTIKFVNSKHHLQYKLNELGWDPLQQLYEKYKIFLKNKITNSNKTIAELLMNQKIFAGVGNYIKSESLYDAGISPWRRGNSLTDKDIDILCQSIIKIMNNSYTHQGATIKTYKNVYGEEGKYSSQFQVYGKNMDPQGNLITAETTPDKRTSFWVKSLQI